MSTSKQRQFANQASLKQALFAGAIAGTAVDTALFPLGEKSISFSLSIVSCLPNLISWIVRHCQDETAIPGWIRRIGRV